VRRVREPPGHRPRRPPRERLGGVARGTPRPRRTAPPRGRRLCGRRWFFGHGHPRSSSEGSRRTVPASLAERLAGRAAGPQGRAVGVRVSRAARPTRR
jgi:hypothetical protein